MSLASGTKLGPYQILGSLGAGGMGEVYRARDTKLDRDVAVKVLPAHLTGNPESLARFEREAKAVAALSHPNILAIFDFGTHDGLSYAVTELLEGETLRYRLDGGALPSKQVIDWGTQIARGLGAAHEKGLVHRDLKPENVFVTRDGQVKILDFGLALRRPLDAAGREQTAASEHPKARNELTAAPTIERALTEPGTVMGTVGYMSPEQVRGLPVDHRSDIFSFGAILYEMVAGRKAFRRETASDTMAAIMRDEPPDLTATGNVSIALDHIVRHCLEKEASDRFQSARDVAFALSESLSGPPITTKTHFVGGAARRRRLAILGVAAFAVLAAGAALLWKRARPAAAPSGVRRIAVLPFENLGTPDDDYFADGIADAIRGKLTGLPGVEVIARGSSTPYKKTTKTPQEIARELDARYLLSATVRWQKAGSESRVQVSPELVEVREAGAPALKWQQPFDATTSDVFQVQSDIASRVAEALGVALGEGQKKELAARPTADLAAYEAYLKGDQVYWNPARNDSGAARQGLVQYRRAVALDPGFALAWARISQASSTLAANASVGPEIAREAKEAAEKAISLAPGSADAYHALGNYYRLAASDPPRALQAYLQGQKLAPGNADIARGLSQVDMQIGKWDDALVHARDAFRLDPRSTSNLSNLAELLIRLRRTDEALPVLDRAKELDPASLSRLQYSVVGELQRGDLTAAQAEVAQTLKHVDPTEVVAFLANYFDLAWVLDPQQLALLQRLSAASFDGDEATWAYCLAQGCALSGDAACTRDFAERSAREAEAALRTSPNDHALHAIRGMALAYLGRKTEAIAEGRSALALTSADAQNIPYYHHQLARIAAQVGEQDLAIDELEALLKVPYFVTPAWLKIDPNFASLRSNPRFQKLVGAKP